MRKLLRVNARNGSKILPPFISRGFALRFNEILDIQTSSISYTLAIHHTVISTDFNFNDQSLILCYKKYYFYFYY